MLRTACIALFFSLLAAQAQAADRLAPITLAAPQLDGQLEFESAERLRPPEPSKDDLPKRVRKAYATWKAARSKRERRAAVEKAHAPFHVSEEQLSVLGWLAYGELLEARASSVLDGALDRYSSDPCHERGDCRREPVLDLSDALSAYRYVAGSEGILGPLWGNYALAVLLLERDPAAAAAALRKVVLVDGSAAVRAEAWRMLGDLSEDLGGARDAYIKAANLGSGRVKSYSLLMIAWLAYAEGEPAGALELAARAICDVDVEEHREAAIWLVTRSLADMRDWSGSTLSESVDPPCRTELLGELGRWAVDAGHLDEALLALNAALRDTDSGERSDRWRELRTGTRERLAGSEGELPAHWLKRVARYCLTAAAAQEAGYAGGTLTVRGDHGEPTVVKLEIEVIGGPSPALRRIERCLEGPLPQPRGRYRPFEVTLNFGGY